MFPRWEGVQSLIGVPGYSWWPSAARVRGVGCKSRLPQAMRQAFGRHHYLAKNVPKELTPTPTLPARLSRPQEVVKQITSIAIEPGVEVEVTIVDA